MKEEINIAIDHLTRVEGHGNIRIRIEQGRLVESRWEIVETPRFFEAMLKGMALEMSHLLTARVCGICSIGHALASLRAGERALGIEIPPTARRIRLLAKHGETLQSHFLHLFFLVAPDFFRVPSVLPLVESDREIVEIALRLKRAANEMCDVLAGRTTHPVGFCPGGLGRMPEKKQLAALRHSLHDRLHDVDRAVELFAGIELPEFERETEFVSLRGEGTYPWIGGDLISSDGLLKGEDEYLTMTNEYTVEDSTSKLTRLSRSSFSVGALARFNNNQAHLHPFARETARRFGLEPICHNPFMNNIAQLVECVHIMYESLELLDELLDGPPGDYRVGFEIRSGEGVGAVEVPRGILYHHFRIDERGHIVGANCVIPTTQNHGAIRDDLPALVEQQLRRGEDDESITRACEMLIRSYDPCISCSVH